MPIVETLMTALVGRYGKAEGERVYHAMEGEGKGPFGPNGKYHHLHVEFADRHGLAPITKKAGPSKKGRPSRR